MSDEGDGKPAVTTDALGRRIWDKAAFEKKAKDRAESERLEESGNKPYVKPVRRDDLRGREKTVDLDSRLGKTRLLSGAHDKGGGYYCKLCDCVLRDSIGYLDHINGKKHQRNMNMSMRVEKVGLSRVQERLAAKKRALTQAQEPEEYDLDARVAALQDEEEQRRQEKKRRKKEKKEAAKRAQEQDALAAEADAGMGMDPDMAAMMGFGGFGGSKKN